MIGKVVAVILGVVVIGVVVVGFLAFVPSPSTCTPDAAAGDAAGAEARWEAWTTAGAGSSVTFTEAEATAILRSRRPDLAIKDPVVHFCGDGSVQLSFSYPLGPVAVKGVATGTIEATSPLSVTVESVAIGGLPSAATDAVLGSVKQVASDASSLGLAGPVKSVAITQGTATIGQ